MGLRQFCRAVLCTARRRLRILPLALAGLGCSANSAVAAERTERPNIVFILADDLGWGDASCYNSDSKIPTPHIDELAREGMRFTDAHSSSAVCTPTRYGILTGRYDWRTRLKEGVLWGYSPALIEPDRLTVPKFLQGHGYHTACIGKWHLGLQDGEETDYGRPLVPGPLEAGFDEFFGIPASLDMEPYLFIRDDRPTAPLSGTIDASRHRRQNGGGFWRAGPIQAGFRHEDVLPRMTEEAVTYIERRAAAARARDVPGPPGQAGRQPVPRPFFLYFALTAPHTPWVPSEQFAGKSEVGYYGDFVIQVDEAVGRIAEALDRHGLTEDTLLIVTSDNGSHWPAGEIEKWGHRANGPWRGQKADIHEGGHRVPLVVRWPGRISAGSTSEKIVCLTDLMATCAGILGADLPPGAGPDSFDISPVLFGRTGEKPDSLVARGRSDRGAVGDIAREAIVHHSMSGMFAIRHGDWKLILGRGSGGFTAPQVIEPAAGEPQGQLYNLARDPAEADDVFPENPEIVERLTDLLLEYQNAGSSRTAGE